MEERSLRELFPLTGRMWIWGCMRGMLFPLSITMPFLRLFMYTAEHV